MILDVNQKKLLETIQGKLVRGDVTSIAKKTRLSIVYVSRVLSPNCDDFNEDVVSKATELIAAREQNTKTLLKKLTA